MTRTVFCLATTQEQANKIVDHLMSSGFENENISIVYPDKQGNVENRGEFGSQDFRSSERNVRGKNVTTEKKTKAPEGGVTGATAGGILGGSLGLLAGIGALAIPGLGPFIAAGPIMAALSGSAIGGSVGLLVGALVGAGIPEYEAKKYETALKSGNILISVTTEDETELKQAQDIMKKDGAKNISTSSEISRSSY